MLAIRDEPAEVLRRGDAPVQFLLRGKLYVVRSVLAHRVEPGRELWRVEAAPGRSGPFGVFDLCYTSTHAGWSVSRFEDGAER
jgi:hypothetical protein